MPTATKPKDQPDTDTAVAVREPTAIERVRAAVEDRIQDIASILPPGMDAQRFARVSLLAISKNPKILDCDRVSIVMAIIEAAEVGLEPTGGIGGAHLVPFKDKQGVKHAQLIYDYRGVQHLIRMGGGGEVKTVLVYEGDDFEVYEGTTEARIDHRPKYQAIDPAKVTYVYAVPLDNPSKFEVMTRAQVEAVRARSKSPNDGPWVTDWGPQARKTVLKRISAWLPLRPEIRQALDNDTMRDIPEPSGDGPKSRTAALREELEAKAPRRRRAQARQNAPGAPDKAKVTDTAAPDASAVQQPAGEPVETVEGEAREVCGAESPKELGDVETCSLMPGHLDGDPKPPQVHKGASGSTWPAGQS